MKTIKFEVMSYALFDSIYAILNQNSSREKYTVHVTKEDGNLFIVATAEQKPMITTPGDDCENTTCDVAK